MFKYLRILAVLTVLFLAFPVTAQDAAPPESSPSVTIAEEDLKKLITTLESETGRTEFISNLKTLAETQKKEDGPTTEEAIAPLTKTLGVDSFTRRVITKYEDFLIRNDLKGSTVGKLVLTLLVTLVGAGLIFVLRRGATKFLYWFDRAISWLNLPATRMRLYTRVLRGIVTISIMVLVFYTYTLIWDFNSEHNPFESNWFKTAVGLLINLAFVVALATVVWETLNAMLQVAVRRMDTANSARARTIMPIVRNVLFIVFAVLFSLVLLSEIGINIVPLLAGAGIVGVAIGFGAQTMVKDFLTGFTIILEDVVRVGDVARMAGYGGVVEKITLRKMQLRDYNGTVYTIPFSQITTIENLTKDFSMYEINMGVAYKENTDKVVEVMKEVAEQMRADPTFADDILEPIEIAGVDKFGDWAVIIKARIKTKPIRQWAVGREYNRRLKKAFDAHDIEIPFPQQVTWNANPPVTVVQEKHPGDWPAAGNPSKA